MWAAWAPFCDRPTLAARSPAIQRAKSSPALPTSASRVGTLLMTLGMSPSTVEVSP